MKKVMLFFTALVLVSSCGGGGADVTSIDKLPKMTDPVTAQASLSSVRINAATTGLNYYDALSTSFTTSSSRAMCESFNVTRDVLNRAALADKILCYIQNAVVLPANAGQISSPDDGNYHVISLDFGEILPDPGYNNQRPKAKFKIVKDGDKIVEFEIFLCLAGSEETPEQSSYLRQTISGNSINIVNKSVDSNYSGSAVVTGELDGTQFTQKQITTMGYGHMSGATEGYEQSHKVVMDQYANAMVISAYQAGASYSDSHAAEHNYTSQTYANYELLNGTNSNMHLWAMGDGSAKIKTHDYGKFPDSGNFDNTIDETVFSWLGDTRENTTSTSGMFYTAANAGLIPATDPTEETKTIALEASEEWDCSGAAEGLLELTDAAITTTCDVYSFMPDNEDNWINCYQSIE